MSLNVLVSVSILSSVVVDLIVWLLLFFVIIVGNFVLVGFSLIICLSWFHVL